MRKVRLYWNPRKADRKFFMTAKLPVRQRLFFIGPVFVLVQPRRAK